MKLSSEQIKSFQKTIWVHYRTNKRTFPWRQTQDPYKILVSEFMLQQTQTERVIPKYHAFLKKFPTIKKLSKAALPEVLLMWSGLGYNRRAKFLWQSAVQLMAERNGIIPDSVEELKKLPGIGEYTAHALRAFIFDLPSVCIETNIRTVYLSSFFEGKTNVTDKEILSLIEQTLPKKNIREWYYALMDFGVALKAKRTGIDKQSKHYKKQNKFQGSNRQVRGAIIRILLKEESLSIKKLDALFPEKQTILPEIIEGLVKEGLVIKQKTTLTLK